MLGAYEDEPRSRRCRSPHEKSTTRDGNRQSDAPKTGLFYCLRGSPVLPRRRDPHTKGSPRDGGGARPASEMRTPRLLLHQSSASFLRGLLRPQGTGARISVSPDPVSAARGAVSRRRAAPESRKRLSRSHRVKSQDRSNLRVFGGERRVGFSCQRRRKRRLPLLVPCV